MIWGKLTSERCRVFTLENADIDHEMVKDIGAGIYEYSEFAARKFLLENQYFQWDCAAFGFPTEMNVLESNTPDAFDVEIYWRN